MQEHLDFYVIRKKKSEQSDHQRVFEQTRIILPEVLRKQKKKQCFYQLLGVVFSVEICDILIKYINTCFLFVCFSPVALWTQKNSNMQPILVHVFCDLCFVTIFFRGWLWSRYILWYNPSHLLKDHTCFLFCENNKNLMLLSVVSFLMSANLTLCSCFFTLKCFSGPIYGSSCSFEFYSLAFALTFLISNCFSPHEIASHQAYLCCLMNPVVIPINTRCTTTEIVLFIL